MITKLFPREEGQGLVEYALILVLIAVVVIAILLLLGPAVSQVYCRVASALQPGSCGAITSYKIKVTGGGKVLHVQNITVSKNTTIEVTVKDETKSQACTPSSCSNINFNVGSGGGSCVITTDMGDHIAFSY